MTRDVHCCVTVDYRQIANDNIANQIHGFTHYGKFILMINIGSQDQSSCFQLSASFPQSAIVASVEGPG